MKVELYDTTLRDGAQTEGISFSVTDKLSITKRLDSLGVHFIEGGWPGSNPKDINYFKQAASLKLKNSQIVAFGSTRRAQSRASEDEFVRGLLAAKTRTIAIFGKAWDMHVKDVLKVSLDENLKMISDTVGFLKSRGVEVIYDAEHFFDGYKSNPGYALKTILAAAHAGAKTICLCETNGGAITSEVSDIVKAVKKQINLPLGIHAHNDTNMAVANSIAAIQAGCTHVHGTINGYGERCGNADLCSVIPILKLKLNIDCVSHEKLKELTEVSRYVAEISNMRQMSNEPFVGASAFAHKGGVHINAVVKNPRTYEHIDPDVVGNKRHFLISDLAGKTSILIKAKEAELGLEKESPQLKKIHKLIQKLEHEGYQFEAAEGSFNLLLEKALGRYKEFFKLESFKIVVEKKENNKLHSEAIIKIKVRSDIEHSVSEGDGPVNALDNAIRKALKGFYPALSHMHLTDFKVRVLEEGAGTAAKVRVLIQSQDEKDSWGTVGVSENIIEASWEALRDSIEYKLLKDKIK